MRKRTPLKAIRNHCFKCNGYEPGNSDSHKPVKAVRECEVVNCDFYEFRFGKNPHHPLSKAKHSLSNLNKFQKQ